MKNDSHHTFFYKEIKKHNNPLIRWVLSVLHFIQWTFHLLLPDEIVSKPSLKKSWSLVVWHQRFHTLRYAFGAFISLAVILGVSAFSSLRSSPLLLAASTTFPFTTPANYTFNSSAINLSTGIASLLSIDQVDDDNTATGFAGGTFSDTEFSVSNLQLDATGIINGSGTFTSRIIDAGASVSWSTISWTPQSPYTKELPDNGGIETAYASQNVSMSGNQLLLHLNESGGATVFTDTSGNAVNGSCSDCPSSATGVFNNAFTFDGTGNGIEIPNTILNGTGDSSASIWFKTDKTGQQALISGANNSNNNEYLIFLSNQTTIAFYTGETEGGNVSWSVPSIADDEWHHLVITRDDTNNEMTAYLDGSLLSTQSTTLNMVSIEPGGLYIAQEQDSVGGGFADAQAFDGELDEIAVFNRVLGASEVTALYERAFDNVRFQLRSCDDVLCDTEQFIGPDGTAATFYDELQNATANLPSLAITNLSDNQYFQYQATFTSSDNLQTPQVSEVSIGPAHFDASTPSIEPVTGLPFTSLTGFTETLGGGNAGTVQYQLSNDGVTYYYHDGSSWTVAVNASQSNTALSVNTQISSFVSDVGSGDFFFRAFFFSTNGTEAVELDEVSIDFENDPGNNENGGGSFLFLALPPTPPAEGFALIINEDDEFTETETVQLTFNAGSDIQLVELSNEPSMTESTTLSFASTIEWNLCSVRGIEQTNCESGEKTVYARFSKGVGFTPSEVVSDTIILTENVGTPIEPVIEPPSTNEEEHESNKEEENLPNQTDEQPSIEPPAQEDNSNTTETTPSQPIETTPPPTSEPIAEEPALPVQQEPTSPISQQEEPPQQPSTDPSSQTPQEQQIQVTPNGVLISSTITNGTLSQSTIPTSLSEPTPGYYNDAFIIFTSGEVTGQIAKVEQFIDGQFFFTPPLSSQPLVDDQFTITIPLPTEETSIVSSTSPTAEGIATILRDYVYPRDLMRTIFWSGVLIGSGVMIILLRTLQILWQHHMITHHATSIPLKKTKKSRKRNK